MTKTVYCVKLQRDALSLSSPPFPGALGEEIYQQVSQEAWSQWLNHQTMLINEYRLSLIDPKAREFLRDELKKFFFGEGSQKPSGFIPEMEKIS